MIAAYSVALLLFVAVGHGRLILGVNHFITSNPISSQIIRCPLFDVRNVLA